MSDLPDDWSIEHSGERLILDRDRVAAELGKLRTEVYEAAREQAAKIADSAVDPEWPNDDQSMQCKRIASDIRAMQPPET